MTIHAQRGLKLVCKYTGNKEKEKMKTYKLCK